MKKILPGALLAFSLLGQNAPAQDSPLPPPPPPLVVLAEEPPLLSAGAILRPEFLTGPNFRVLDAVTTWQGRNFYNIETPWGYFQADGDAMLMARLAEIRALTELQRVSRTDEFKSALKAAAKKPLRAAEGLITDPLGSVQDTAKGVWKFMGRTKETIKHAANNELEPTPDGDAGKELLGVAKARRALALRLGVDPYTTNEFLKQELDKVAWAQFAGNGIFQVATMPIGGGAGMLLNVAEASQTLQDSLLQMSPADLRMANRKRLLSMGLDTQLVESFLQSPAFTPTTQTVFVVALGALQGVKNRADFVALAAQSATNEGDALFFSGTAQLLATLHNRKDKLAEIVVLGEMPVAIAADGRLVLALQWDTAFWSERAAQFIDFATTAQIGQAGRPLVVAITGNATAMTKAELEKRKVGLVVNIFGGPQK